MSVIAIDGPSASGKSTTARRVANDLSMVHLNSGLLYRAITWMALRDGWRSTDDIEAGLAAGRLNLAAEPTGFEVSIDGQPAGEWLLSAQVNSRVSAISAIPTVRDHVVSMLREATRAIDVVVDGRDIGTVVFPDAMLKVFLTASPGERARRRLVQRKGDPGPTAILEEVGRLTERDRLDAGRAVAPLARAEDAVELDTTSLEPEEVVARIVQLYRNRVAELG